MIELGFFIVLISLGYFVGRHNENKHIAYLDGLEKELSNIKLIPVKKNIPYSTQVVSSKLVMGSTVISIDYFKKVLAGFYNILGGRISSYESLLDRARRDAIIRMKLESKDHDFIANVRIETSSIGGNSGTKGSVGAIEVLAYGTAVKLEK